MPNPSEIYLNDQEYEALIDGLLAAPCACDPRSRLAVGLSRPAGKGTRLGGGLSSGLPPRTEILKPPELV